MNRICNIIFQSLVSCFKNKRLTSFNILIYGTILRDIIFFHFCPKTYSILPYPLLVNNRKLSSLHYSFILGYCLALFRI